MERVYLGIEVVVDGRGVMQQAYVGHEHLIFVHGSLEVEDLP